MAKRKTNEEFIKEVYELVGDEYTFLEEYTNARTKIRCKHNECGHEWEILPSDFLRYTRCPKCHVHGNFKGNDSFVKEVYNLVGDEFKFLEKYKGSDTKIKCRHSKCGHEWRVKPSQILSGYGCPWCNNPNYNRCDNEFKKDIYKLVGDEYTFLEEYTNAKTKIECVHNICGYKWKVTPHDFYNGCRCPECRIADRTKSNEDFVKDIYDIVGDEYEFLEKYKNNKKRILCRHNTCGYTWMVRPDNFISGTRCPDCRIPNYHRDTTQFKSEVYELEGNNYEVLSEYSTAKTKITMKHNECGYKYDVIPDKFLQGQRCPQCAESKGEQGIRQCLESRCVRYQQEYSFDDLLGVGGKPLRFDFAIYNNKGNVELLIEYDGEFHYQNIYEDGGFEILRIHDERKNQYCKSNDIPLLRIPYWEFDNIEKILNEWLGSLNKN